MTEKRFSCTENGFVVDYESEHKLLNLYDAVDCLNALHEDNQRLIRKNKRLHRDWDKLYDLCLDKGCTEDEIIKEMER